MSDTDLYEKRIAQYDKAYKIFMVIAITIVLIGVIIGVRQVFAFNHRIDERTAEINQHINCELSLFTQPGRSNLTIKDIQSCTLVRE